MLIQIYSVLIIILYFNNHVLNNWNLDIDFKIIYILLYVIIFYNCIEKLEILYKYKLYKYFMSKYSKYYCHLYFY